MPETVTLQGQPPLTPRWEPWMRALLADPERVAAIVAEHGSPVNVLNPEPLTRNAAELTSLGPVRDLEIQLFFARKANKALCFVDAAARAGLGVDVASEAELAQVLDAGVRPERIIVSAAIKNRALLSLALTHGVTVSLDHLGELAELTALAAATSAGGRGVRPPVALRLALPPSSGVAPTRFGELADRWLGADLDGVDVTGVHFHLNGYSAAERVTGIVAACDLVDALRDRGHRPWFVDAGGGVPMSYLDDAQEWETFWEAQRAAVAGEAEPLTWNGHPLTTVYPYHQQPTRRAWLTAVLDAPARRGEGSVAQALAGRRLSLHLEPGRALLDGCGLTLARVAFTKQRSDGVGLIGVEMNRTQCRTTSDDFLVDPELVTWSGADAPFTGFLVGAYCIENELILQRRLTAPGIAPGDIVALPNTAGYFMHILESGSHQWPLARNVVWQDAGPLRQDRING
ncbi:Y4yA family PLP-dependent enzyme [Propioniciclava soli]|uniref:Y4yA family PLP-dependent enzyme n=1 Tax=Propioniciclava soli TaxID=2775081 RepID=UPI001E5C645B|nr:Y4yA family PLP-dependent enzyme [Propioniciclava soli]